MNGNGDIIGTGSTVEKACEDLAERIVKELAPPGLSKDELEEYFADKPYNVRLEIEVQPHNQWVKTYKATTPRG